MTLLDAPTPNANPAVASPPDSPGSPADGPQPLFPGDRGELALETRRVLVQLLLGPALDGRRHGLLWPVLLRDEAILRTRLSDLFLDLILDTDQQVAFTRQAETGDLDVPILLRRAQLTFVDSIVLLFLRQRLTHADVQGERAVVSLAEIHEHLLIYQRSTSTDTAGFAKRIRASIEKIKNHNLLQKIRGSEERYEISPTLKLLFSAEAIQALAGQYERLTAGGRPDSEQETADDQEEDI